MNVNRNTATRQQLGLELAVVINMAIDACRDRELLPSSLFNDILNNEVAAGLIAHRVTSRLNEVAYND